MRPIPSIVRCGATAVVWLAAASATAQEVQVQRDARTAARVKARESDTNVWAPGLRGLSNQLRPFYRYELMHIRAACGLSREQLQEIRPESDAAYEQAIAVLDDARRDSTRSTGADDPDYQQVIRRAVHSVVRRHVGAEQWDALQADIRRRAASRKDAAVDLLVAVLDRDLFLTGAQRRQIAESVSAHWEDRFVDPLEVAFNDQSRCPKIPDELVTSYLTPAQREAWGRIPQLQGRLWGVTIDHGGGPDMERELGAAGAAKPPRPRPAVGFAPDRIIIRNRPAAPAEIAAVRAQPLRALDLRVAQRPAVIVRPAPAQNGDDEPENGPDAALARQQQLQLERMKRLREVYLSILDHRVFGEEQKEAAARLEAETALSHRVDSLRLAGRLADDQWKKLRAAGHGDIKRFFDRLSDAREKMAGGLDQRALARVLTEEPMSLFQEWTRLKKVEGPLFTKTLDRTITDAQSAAIEKEDRDRRAFRLRADVRWTTVLLARSLGLTDDQRRRLESLLLERTRPPNRFDSFDYTIVMYQASRIPEDEIRPIFDDLQWRVMTEEFAAVRRWGLHLKQGHFLPDEMFADDPGGGPPPIQMLAPPILRR